MKITSFWPKSELEPEAESGLLLMDIFYPLKMNFFKYLIYYKRGFES